MHLQYATVIQNENVAASNSATQVVSSTTIVLDDWIAARRCPLAFALSCCSLTQKRLRYHLECCSPNCGKDANLSGSQQVTCLQDCLANLDV